MIHNKEDNIQNVEVNQAKLLSSVDDTHNFQSNEGIEEISSLPPAIGRRQIKHLDESVVRRIAAGEVVLSAVNAVKELVENALDAGGRRVLVLCTLGQRGVGKSGANESSRIDIGIWDGIRNIEVEDDGIGMQGEDLMHACERFATSKLEKFEDLMEVRTYGFRGEALASLALVSRSLQIYSRPRGSPVCLVCSYLNGEPTGPPSPSPRTTFGTKVVLNDLFYTQPARRAAFSFSVNANVASAVPGSCEYSRCLQLLQNFAIHFPYVQFQCKRRCARLLDLNSGMNLDKSSLKDDLNQRDYTSSQYQQLQLVEDRKCIIERIYGKDLSSQLEILSIFKEIPIFIRCNGLLTRPSFSMKKGVFILFINDRLVNCTPLKRCIESCYYSLLPRNMKPFVYLDIKMKHSNVDINVHPTKREVKFLHEQDIINLVSTQVQELLLRLNERRHIPTQDDVIFCHELCSENGNDNVKKTNHADSGNDYDNMSIQQLDNEILKDKESIHYFQKSKMGNSNIKKRKSEVLPLTRVRTDLSQASINLYFPSKKNFSINEFEDKGNYIKCNDPPCRVHFGQHIMDLRIRKSEKSDGQLLQSVQMLKQLYIKKSDDSIGKMLTTSTFIGAVSPQHVLLQHKSLLLCANIRIIVKECIYQSLLNRIGELPFMNFEEKIPLIPLLLLAIEEPNSGYYHNEEYRSTPTDRLAVYLAKQLETYADMLQDYFSISINNGYLYSLTDPCGGYFPGQEYLPMLFLRLAAQVDWSDELECLDGICRLLSDFFSKIPSNLNYDLAASNLLSGDNTTSISQYAGNSEEIPARTECVQLENYKVIEKAAVVFERVFYVAIWLNKNFRAPRKYKADKTVIELTNLDSLYHIFERC